MSKLVCYKSDQIPYVWERTKGLVQKALDRGSIYTLSEIRRGLCRSEMQLWTSQTDKCDPSKQFEAALVTTIQNRGHQRWCLLLCAGGNNIDAWVQWLPEVEMWASQNGCDEMRIYGRIGWARKLGYDVDYTKMSKAI